MPTSKADRLPTPTADRRQIPDNALAARQKAHLHDRLAVIMITHNRRPEALRALGELARLPEQPRVIVVDNGSGDGTAAAVTHSYPSVRLIALEGNIGAAARTIGVEAAGTPYVAFCDDDSWWQAHSLEKAVEVLDHHPSVAVVVARTRVGDRQSEDPLNGELAGSPLPARPGLPGPRVMGFMACAAVVRSAAYLQAGGFHRKMLVGGEEELLACDLVCRGWDLVYVAEVVAHHHPSQARSAELRRRRGLRNALWFFWLRRRGRGAIARTLQLLATAPRDTVTLRAVGDALAGLPWIVRNRRPVPRRVERELRMLDEPQTTSTARRYVS